MNYIRVYLSFVSIRITIPFRKLIVTSSSWNWLLTQKAVIWYQCMIRQWILCPFDTETKYFPRLNGNTRKIRSVKFLLFSDGFPRLRSDGSYSGDPWSQSLIPALNGIARLWTFAQRWSIRPPVAPRIRISPAPNVIASLIAISVSDASFTGLNSLIGTSVSLR